MAQECVLCGDPSDQAGRFCSACVGPSERAAAQADIDVGPAQVRALRILQWPIAAGLLVTTALAGMRSAAFLIQLLAVEHQRPVDIGLNAVQERVVFGGVVLVVVVGVLWLAWWAVAYANLRPLGVLPRQERSWAVLAWLVPLADLVVPQRVADELWRGSDPWAPLGWRAGKHARVSTIVRAWWMAWCGAAALLAVAEVATRVITQPARVDTMTIDGVLIASAVLTAVAGLAAIGLVVGVTARQGERARLMVVAGLVSAP